MYTQLLTNFATACNVSVKPFFGLIPWYGYLPNSDFSGPPTCDLTKFTVLPGTSSGPSDIPLVLLAVVDDLLRIAGTVAVGFIIYAAVQYITSQGEPEKAAKAQNTILNAVIGLVIALVAVAAVSFIGDKLGQ
jgi:hypothetical protein